MAATFFKILCVFPIFFVFGGATYSWNPFSNIPFQRQNNKPSLRWQFGPQQGSDQVPPSPGRQNNNPSLRWQFGTQEGSPSPGQQTYSAEFHSEYYIPKQGGETGNNPVHPNPSMSAGFGNQYNIPKQGSETGNNLIHPSPMHQMYYDPSISARFFKMSGQGRIHSRSRKVAPPWYYLLYFVYKGVPSVAMWVQIK
ncbi:hypothetical protein EZV62_012784 [Acer yangbiense]|uniref:Galactose oxidase-like Early set domain-containing protein n=1 Tax=Acer yangbiense TaxID=1000413 RepID=A0A5C7HWB6_9ROSI|nr:hypothetical protein EZV62_012784 [Acer yangbiense]